MRDVRTSSYSGHSCRLDSSSASGRNVKGPCCLATIECTAAHWYASNLVHMVVSPCQIPRCHASGSVTSMGAWFFGACEATSIGMSARLMHRASAATHAAVSSPPQCNAASVSLPYSFLISPDLPQYSDPFALESGQGQSAGDHAYTNRNVATGLSSSL